MAQTHEALNTEEMEKSPELLTESMEQELTDEQLLQLAEGSCTWGANCG